MIGNSARIAPRPDLVEFKEPGNTEASRNVQNKKGTACYLVGGRSLHQRRCGAHCRRESSPVAVVGRAQRRFAAAGRASARLPSPGGRGGLGDRRVTAQGILAPENSPRAAVFAEGNG